MDRRGTRRLRNSRWLRLSEGSHWVSHFSIHSNYNLGWRGRKAYFSMWSFTASWAFLSVCLVTFKNFVSVRWIQVYIDSAVFRRSISPFCKSLLIIFLSFSSLFFCSILGYYNISKTKQKISSAKNNNLKYFFIYYRCLLPNPYFSLIPHLRLGVCHISSEWLCPSFIIRIISSLVTLLHYYTVTTSESLGQEGKGILLFEGETI